VEKQLSAMTGAESNGPKNKMKKDFLSGYGRVYEWKTKAAMGGTKDGLKMLKKL
jgi:hypothetical protein